MTTIGPAALAKRIGRPYEWVHANAQKLGGKRVTVGNQSRWRFDEAKALAAFQRMVNGDKSPTARAAQRRKDEVAAAFANQVATGKLRIRQATPEERRRFAAERQAYRDAHPDDD